MTSLNKVIYVPSLRMKMGELEGLRALREDVQDCILPLLIVPPLKERSSDSQILLFPASETIPDVGGVLSKYWARRSIFIDSRALFDEYDVEKAVTWLPDLFNRARNLGVPAIPTASLGVLETIGVDAFRKSISESYKLKFGLRILSGDIDPRLGDRVQALLSNMGLVPAECAVLADFSDADLSDYLLVAPIIRAALEQLQEFGQWQLVVFQGTHFPETNPAKKAGQTVSHPRNEWHAWREAVKFDPSTAEHMVFGDFAADCAKFAFGGKGGRPIPHCRYTTESDWLVVRGDEEGSMHEVMKDVFARILNSGVFSGSSFSEADRYIDDVANNFLDSSGNATTWRQINTTHHITRVVADIAKVRGIPITELPTSQISVQLKLLNK